ncbi:hypothetical protein BDZ85DRAFT_124212 [Elsinoe ampelina]|uniref:Secreted protein n=1 Tax=Elsinoe ampelina TaxID=302913 RepID=A0A6A6GBY6_9PEZI|nr:hypothetical protein BDZ85DRAFT_124212 [Elsinoe ampelina]
MADMLGCLYFVVLSAFLGSVPNRTAVRMAGYQIPTTQCMIKGRRSARRTSQTKHPLDPGCYTSTASDLVRSHTFVIGASDTTTCIMPRLRELYS